MHQPFNRRRFLTTAAATGATLSVVRSGAAEPAKPAALGGAPVRSQPFPGWPVVEENDEKAILEVLQSGQWFRGSGPHVERFESAFAQLMGAKHCVATANGTSSLYASLAALGVEPGDEVLVSPYTFIATVNAILLQYALPVFVDTDPETFLIDHTKIEAKITDRSVAILPVHIGGAVAHMDGILEVAKKHNLPVIEDACQAHLAEWKGKKVGSLGDTGCFSFQVTKNIPSGEGGAILTRDEELAQRCYAFHNNCRPRAVSGYNFSYLGGRGANLRMTAFQGNLLLSQMTRTEAQSRTREQNAEYLTQMLKEIPGIEPARMYDGVTRNAYHLYMFRYNPEAFDGLSRDRFSNALRAEGIPNSRGYSPLNKESFLSDALASKGFRRVFPADVLDRWAQRNECPANDKLCQEAVWFTQTMLLGPRGDMDQIAEAIRKIKGHAGALARA